ncbi:hypothetical protein GOODEAATRI_017546 [Goodea atripinnis]|uniref:RING-type domain-containing protein n=1 Tax=Goodea atripinnis TaxID=208336 RepID=A0ABV0NL20_9TELE
MQTKRIWLFSAHLLPLVARLCLVPLETIVFINRFSMIFTGLEVIYFLASNLLVPYNLAKTAYRELAQVVEVYGLLALGMSLWNQLVLPVLFMCFWLVLFALQIYTYFSTRDQPTSRERLLFLFLTSIAECCSTPYSLLGLVFTVSFIALGVLTLCKFYLQGYRAFVNDNTMHRSLWKHFRAVSLCLFLLIFPAYMSYMICQFFHMDFWLLIIISSSILTSLQDLNSAVITPCSHFFHAGCLKKWLYVQETCPLCHSQLKSQSPASGGPNQDIPAADPSPAGQEGAAAVDKEGDSPDNDVKEEGGDGTATSAEEASSSSGMHSAPLYLVRPLLSSSSSCSSSSSVTDSIENQLQTDHPSTSSCSTSNTPDIPANLRFRPHMVAPSILHHSSSSSSAPQVLNPAEVDPQEIY